MKKPRSSHIIIDDFITDILVRTPCKAGEVVRVNCTVAIDVSTRRILLLEAAAK